MAEKNQFEKILRGSRYQISKLADQSNAWYRKEIGQLNKIKFNPRSFILGGDNYKRVEIGKMYLYRYAPKYMDTLEIWDEYPLVLPFTPTENGFIGINFHYLPYKHRAWLLDRLLKTASLKNDRLRVSWQILNAVSRVNVGEMATHRYIASHITTPLRVVRIEDYGSAIMLPIAKFHGNNASYMKRVLA